MDLSFRRKKKRPRMKRDQLRNEWVDDYAGLGFYYEYCVWQLNRKWFCLPNRPNNKARLLLKSNAIL